MVDSVDSDHLPLTSPIPNLHMWRLHIFSSSKTNVGHFWKLNQLGKPPGRDKTREKTWLDLEFQHLDQEAGGNFGGFFSRQRKSVFLGVWKREGLTTKGNTKRRIRCCRFFPIQKTSPWNFSEIFLLALFFVEKNLRLLLIQKGLF